MNLFIRSLQLDLEFLSLDLSLEDKIEFIWKKYLLLFRYIFLRFIFRNNYISLFGRKYFFDDKYGIAVLQSTYTDNFLLKDFINSRAIIVDIGANIGQFRFFCEHVLRAKKVYSFEPIKSTYDVLQKNFPRNSYNYAISTKKNLTFFIPGLSVWASSLPQENNIRKEQVIGMRLDNIKELKAEKKIDLLKIDVEGAEEDVLVASKNILKKAQYILIEVSIDRIATSDVFSLFQTLKSFLPGVSLIRIGRSYNNPTTHTTGAVDILFKNNA